MKQTFTAVDHFLLPRGMRPDDARIPDDVRAHLGDYATPITAVAPVPGIDRTEWLLFDANHVLVDSLFAGTRNRGAH